MDVEIRRLTPELADDYLHFFDATPHATHKDEHKCYCVWWSNADYDARKLITSKAARRDYAHQCIKSGHIRGYLAYRDEKVVGWCNAIAKKDCTESYCWIRFMGEVSPADQEGSKVKSIVCFAIAPKIQRKGLARRFVERVCRDASIEGFDIVEAYPNKTYVDAAEDFMGPFTLYERSGFCIHHETRDKYVMRKALGKKAP